MVFAFTINGTVKKNLTFLLVPVINVLTVPVRIQCGGNEYDEEYGIIFEISKIRKTAAARAGTAASGRTSFCGYQQGTGKNTGNVEDKRWNQHKGAFLHSWDPGVIA